MKKILPFFSYLLHPLFIPVLSTLYFFLLDENFLVPAEKYLILIQVVIITILIPISFYFLLRSLGKINSVMAKEINERKAPLFLQMVLLYLLIRNNIVFDSVPELYYFFLCAMMSLFAALVFVFLKVKVSLHMMGMGGFLFFIIGLGIHNETNFTYTIAAWFVITGFVATSRLEMGAHNLKELGVGFLTGMLPQMAMWYFWL